MKRHVAAAVAFEDFYAAEGQLLSRQQDVCRFGIATQRDDWRVLEQEQYVADAAGFAEFDQFLLDAQAGSVVDAAELEDGDHGGDYLNYRRLRIRHTRSAGPKTCVFYAPVPSGPWERGHSRELELWKGWASICGRGSGNKLDVLKVKIRMSGGMRNLRDRRLDGPLLKGEKGAPLPFWPPAPN